MFKYANLGDTLYFWFASNDTSGSGADGESPVADVRLAGAAVDAAPVLSPTPALLTHANYPDGCHEVAVAATEGNGFAAGNEYAVFCSLAVDSQNPTGFIGAFKLDRPQVEVKEIDGSAVAATSGKLHVLDDEGNAVANEAKQDIIDGLVDDLVGRLTEARAGYLDNLNVGGTLANTNNADSFKANVSALATAAALEALQTHGDGVWATADVSGVSELLLRLTEARAALLDNLSRLDRAITSTETNIRGADNRDLSSVYDKVDSTGGTVGSGADQVTLTIKDDDGNVVSNAAVWISTDSAETNIVAGTLYTNDAGQVTFMLTAGETYYCWRDHPSVNFDNPQSFVAEAD